MYLTILNKKEIMKKRTMPLQKWAMAYGQILIYFADRLAVGVYPLLANRQTTKRQVRRPAALAV